MSLGPPSGMWSLLLAACVALSSGTDCGKQCALCVYRLVGQQPPSTFQTCSLECDGGVDTRKFRLCRELLLDEENQVPALDEEAPGAPGAPAEAPEHRMAKKYGGFMKRYGGFMARRSSPLSSLSSLSSSSSLQGAPEEAGSPGGGGDGRAEEEENIRLEILKILNAEAEGRAAPGQREAKRYGGFMRRAGLQTLGLHADPLEADAPEANPLEADPPEADPLEAVLGRALKKRYGGFMRRVGRPEWLVDDSSKAGVLKRSWEDGSELQKRYGGFMD
ncbi:hypothetical protein NHX12_003975 [Muraenolepis orangiensis]|uniref:Synenkephalin n=1 Tax=Muraenolepis orangiensis TaxID=630683 RepID=A0A9Q0DUK8_9TELE|nr:hypothetical protein NHX12_003975 [Muraenolepis orangiensis]